MFADGAICLILNSSVLEMLSISCTSLRWKCYSDVTGEGEMDLSNILERNLSGRSWKRRLSETVTVSTSQGGVGACCTCR